MKGALNARFSSINFCKPPASSEIMIRPDAHMCAHSIQASGTFINNNNPVMTIIDDISEENPIPK